MSKMSILEVCDYLNVYLSQPHLVSSNGQISQMLTQDYLPSMVFYGPSGSGKTQLAKYISNKTKKNVHFFHGAFSSKKDYENKIKDNDIIFIDEFHNLDKKKQDYVLYLIDQKHVCVLAATTQNPYYSVSNALYSRMLIVEFKDVKQECAFDIIKLVIKHKELWFKEEVQIQISDDDIIFLINQCQNDIRKMLLSIEIIVKTSKNTAEVVIITSELIKKQISYNVRSFENKTQITYDLISALQKSIRGSNVDASLYYLARLIINNELIITLRRLRVIVYEDIGFANLELINRVILTLDVCEKIGLPEAKIPLGLIVSEMALSPKDNSAYLGIKKAVDFVNTNPHLQVEKNVVDKTKTYKYPFDYEHNLVKQEYLPSQAKNVNFIEIKSTSKRAKIYEERRKKLNIWFNK